MSYYKNWDKDILPEIRKRQRIHQMTGVPATIRGLLYVFESMQILHKKDYCPLCKHLVKWRENFHSKDPAKKQLSISGDWIVDKTRRIINIIDYEDEGECLLKIFENNRQQAKDFICPAEWIEAYINGLKSVEDDIYNHIPRWLGQPKYVEPWVEKNAMRSFINSILNHNAGLQVVVAPNGGWSSYTFARDNLDRLLGKKKQGKEIYVQYYGDSDPSGERMTVDDSKLVKLLREHGIHFERVAITEQTIDDFGMEKLKAITDPKTYKKLHERDPNRDWFKQRHRGEIWQIEVDALQLDMNKFTDLVVSKANKHFDEKLHERVVKQVRETYSADHIRDKLKEQLTDLAEELGLQVTRYGSP